MSDAPRLLLSELDATELLLRTLAIENLSYRQILGVERIAGRVCEDLLASVARSAGALEPSLRNVPAVEEATDELLGTGRAAAVAPVAAAAAAVAGVAWTAEPPAVEPVEFEGELEAIPDVEERDDPTDETPASSNEVLLRWNEDGAAPTVVHAADSGPDLEEAASDEVPRGGGDGGISSYITDDASEDEDPTLADGSSIQDFVEAAEGGLYEEPAVDEPSEEEVLVGPPPTEVSDEPIVEEEHDSELGDLVEELAEPGPSTAPGADPWANLVSFSEPPRSDLDEIGADDGTGETEDPNDDPWEERRREERESMPTTRSTRPSALDPGRDALVTMDGGSSVRQDLDLAAPDAEVELDELEELELDADTVLPVGAKRSGSLDEEESFAEEDATMLRAAPSDNRATPGPAPASRAAPPVARVAPPKAVAAKPAGAEGARSGGTGGLYGSAAVPTIRDSDDPRPRAAAVQLNAQGGGRVLGSEEEDEPIEIGEAEDGEEVEAGEGGFSLKVQEYEEEEYEEEEAEEEEADEEPPLEEEEPPPPVGPSASELAAILAAAQAAATSGNLQQGADLYSDLIDQDPDNVEAHVARGRLYLDLGDYSRAMSDFMVAEDLAPTDPEPQVAIGDMYFARKDYRKAIEYFDLALQISPNHAMAFCRRGISHYYRKNYAEAVADLGKAQKLDPDIANIQTYISMAKKKIGK